MKCLVLADIVYDVPLRVLLFSESQTSVVGKNGLALAYEKCAEMMNVISRLFFCIYVNVKPRHSCFERILV